MKKTVIPERSILIVEVSPSERAILQEAADQAHLEIGDFMRTKAIEAVETEILERKNVTIPVEHWDAFTAWLNRPPKSIPALRELARHKPAWER